MKGSLSKLKSKLESSKVEYFLPLESDSGRHRIGLNAFIGKKVLLRHTGEINCISCGLKTKKSYSQGHCFHCSQKLASCDMCILKPETCHFDQGTCREPKWAQKHCMIPHFIYLSNTSGLKVGITRYSQIPTRWIDQGAVEALAVLKVRDRKTAGLIEVELAKHIADKTNWRALLKGNPESRDLKAAWEVLRPEVEELIQKYEAEVLDRDQQEIEFPVTQFPEKIKSYNLDKEPKIQDILQGIKGQYLIFENGVINMRKYGGYEIEFSTN